VKVDGRVLVVDDEPLVVELVRRRLGEAGFRTVAAGCGDEAMRAATEASPPFDVVLAGTHLSDGSGMELVHRLRGDSRTATTSIALMTAARDPEQTFRMLEAGADDCLRKPIDRVELVARVRSLLRIKRQLDELRDANARLEELNTELGRRATTDPLTKLANRQELESRLAHEVDRARRYGHDLGLLVLDIDHFKRVNDTHGHAAGDEVLRRVASVLHESVRRVDLAARYGGEELVVVAPSTDLVGAAKLADRLRRLVERTFVTVPMEGGTHRDLSVTVSVGAAALARGQDAGSLFAAADAALYRAKAGGRNRVERATPPEPALASVHP